MDGGQRVWAPHPVEGYQTGLIVDVGADTLSVEPLGQPGVVVEASYDCVFPAVDEGAPDVEDNCSLIYLNEATLLHNLRVRFAKGNIYTYVANILLAVNPYNEVKGLYSSQTIRKYNGKSIGVLPPHVFAIADKAYREMKSLKLSQSIIVSGESGAGKTESTKFVLRYLTESYGTSAGLIEQRIVEANPLLESFGNAKTMRNNNSSRFGKFVEIHFNDKYEVVGGHVSHYLLEKSRVCSQSAEERSYHVFYRLLAGAPRETKDALGLTNGQAFKYLNPASLKDPAIHDEQDYRTLEQSMDRVGLSPAEKADLYRVIAAVLHLGNICFEENHQNKKGGSLVTGGSKGSLVGVANLLGLEMADLERSLTSRVMTTTKGGSVGTIINVPLKPDQAGNARDALAKALYLRLFNHIVQRVNACFPYKNSSFYIGVLDIAGFEYFQVNSFEQFCINYCNEKLQQYFNARILKEEQELYKRERLGLTEVRYTDNQDCIDLIEVRTRGIIDLLDEECRLPKGSHSHFTETVHHTHLKHFRLSVPRKSKLTYHRNLRDNEGFIVRHFAGAVCYMTSEFLDKNNDALHASLEQLISASKDPFINQLFPGLNTSKAGGNTKKLALDSVGSKFRTQLNTLMEKLGKTGASFIRCLKPNLKMEAGNFIGGQILSQLQCAGMVEVLKLMQGGFPCRAHFNDLYQMYKAVLPAKLARLDPRLFCEALFRAVGMKHEDFRFGMSRVFFRAGKFAEFDDIMRGDTDHLAALVAKVQRWLVCKRWRKAIYGAICVQKLSRKISYRSENALVIQRGVRMFLAMRKHRPRYQGIAQLRTLRNRTKTLSEIVSTLKRDRESLVKRAGQLEASLDQQINKLKNGVVSAADINSTYKALANSTEEFLKELNGRQEQQRIDEEKAEKMRKIKAEQERENKRREEEAARLRALQEEMERERKRREEDELRRQQEENERKLRAELEVRRVREEEERKRVEEEARQRREQEEADRKLAEQLEKENEEKYAQMRAAREQEKRDYELALRLSQDEQSPQQAIAESVSPSAVESQIYRASVQRSAGALSQQQEAARKKHNLTKWKYAELRDTINTSCDVDLLEACRDEFHRRLRVYHAWKDKNKRRTPAGGQGAEPEQRAPQEVLESAQATRAQSPPPPIPPRSSSLTPPPEDKPHSQAHRFFRVPFVRPSADQLDRKKGWWYAHFDGQWVARQLELHPEKRPLLLVAGKNDMDMCELSLEETGLARKRGAEILAGEFEEAWSKYGGAKYVPAASKEGGPKGRKS